MSIVASIGAVSSISVSMMSSLSLRVFGYGNGPSTVDTRRVAGARCGQTAARCTGHAGSFAAAVRLPCTWRQANTCFEASAICDRIVCQEALGSHSYPDLLAPVEREARRITEAGSASHNGGGVHPSFLARR